MTINEQTRELVLYNLGLRGFMLYGVDCDVYEVEKPRMPIEELFIELVKGDVREARYIESLAFVVENDLPDYAKLINVAIERGLVNQTGYILEGIFKVFREYRPDLEVSGLEFAISKLYEMRDPNDQFLTRLDIPNEREALSENRAPEDLKWNILGGITHSQLVAKYRSCHNFGLKEYKRKLAEASAGN
ncbi:MAG: hypothetical protein Q8R00_02515 [Candidatus Nanoarchaeia archaeon]|nr:hypothetical protein [Candidatus Nanoarchaeia archaeon]